MRILLTNNTLGPLQGTELYVYDVARELQRRGHTPIAFSTRLGEVAKMLDAATIPVIDNLNNCGEAPDIIHGQHHLETLTAALYFPDTPVINYCHSWGHPQEAPLIFPRVLRYVAVDEACRERLIYSYGIDPAKVTVLLNFVDTERFRSRGRLPDKPLRALAFGNYFSKGTALTALSEACDEAGMELDVAGLVSNQAVTDPENLLPRYDVVFAKARAALEAMAVGNAVVLAGPRGTGPMITTRNWLELRKSNFGVRTLTQPYEKDTILKELADYDPGNVGEVEVLVRVNSNLVGTVDRLVGLYEAVIRDYRSTEIDSHSCQRAAAKHLNRHGEALKGLQSRNRDEAVRGAFSSLLRSVAIAPGTFCVDVAAGLDSIVRQYGIVRMEGWACDARTLQPAAAILLRQNGECVGYGYPQISRPDAATSMGMREDVLGFEVQFEAAPGAITVLALMPSGELFDITQFANPEVRRMLS